jgi:Ca2+-transporting ATPase
MPEAEKGHETTFWVEGTAVLIAVAIVALVGGFQNWNQEQQFRKLNDRSKDRPVKIIRNGQTIASVTTQILVGDLIALEQGDLVPADGIYITGHCNDQLLLNF